MESVLKNETRLEVRFVCRDGRALFFVQHGDDVIIDREICMSKGNRTALDTIKNNFSYHPPKGDQAERYVELRDMAKSLAFLIDFQCPDSREKSLALTKLEEAVMWANASIARNE